MQALVELIAGFIALLAAAVLSQFGVDIHSPSLRNAKSIAAQTAVRTSPPPSAQIPGAIADREQSTSVESVRLGPWVLTR